MSDAYLNVILESLDRAEQAIATLQDMQYHAGDSAVFRHDGLTLEQWEQARSNYLHEAGITVGIRTAEIYANQVKA